MHHPWLILAMSAVVLKSLLVMRHLVSGLLNCGKTHPPSSFEKTPECYATSKAGDGSVAWSPKRPQVVHLLLHVTGKMTGVSLVAMTKQTMYN